MLPVLSVLAAFAPPPVLDPSTLAWTPGMPDRCECAFVDVGLNNGATLLGWPQTLLQAPHNKTLSELYLKRIRNCLKEANAPCYYGFEASPIHTGPLRALQSRLRTQQIRTLIFAETAFSHEAGNATFYIDESEDVNHPHTRGVGGTIVGDMNVMLPPKSGQGPWKSIGRAARSGLRKAMVPTIDGGLFLRQVQRTSDFVAVKLDVEGHEFAFLTQTLIRNARALCGIDVLAIEWHAWAMQGSGIPARELRSVVAWMLRQPGCGVTVLGWG
jgi:hypothetical protein